MALRSVGVGGGGAAPPYLQTLCWHDRLGQDSYAEKRPGTVLKRFFFFAAGAGVRFFFCCGCGGDTRQVTHSPGGWGGRGGGGGGVVLFFCCGCGGAFLFLPAGAGATRARSLTHLGGGEEGGGGGRVFFLLRVRGRVFSFAGGRGGVRFFFFAAGAGATRTRSLTHRGGPRKKHPQQKSTHNKKKTRVPG